MFGNSNRHLSNNATGGGGIGAREFTWVAEQLHLDHDTEATSTEVSHEEVRKPTTKELRSAVEPVSTLTLVLQRAKKEDLDASAAAAASIVAAPQRSPRSPLRRCSTHLIDLYNQTYSPPPSPSKSTPAPSSPSRRSSTSKSPHRRRSSHHPRSPSLASWCPSEPELDAATLWENTHNDIVNLQSKLSVREQFKFAPPAPHALGCRECGSKDLAAFCWKGCRNFTPLDELYSTNESMVEKQQDLEATVYSQGIALHTTDMKLKEQEQSLHLLQHEIFRLVEWARGHRGPQLPPHTPEQTPSSTLLAVKAMHHQFDLDGDGVLSMDEMNKLKAALGHRTKYTSESFDHLLVSCKLSARPVRFNEGGSGMQVGITPEGLLQLYDVVGGSILAQDLHTLEIHIGRSEHSATSLEASHALLMELKADLTVALESQAQLRTEVEDKSKALARLRESVQAMTVHASSHQEEINMARNGQKRVQDELDVLKKTFDDYVHTNTHSKVEMASSQQAALEMRRLLEIQIDETETWQRQCWALQEQLNVATTTCTEHKQKLWQTTEAKKSEERKNMLLYMQAQLGKKHSPCPTA
ncbi:hypothetical protein H310_03595 [Aphanomyces invadans]|uniref:EF-hand domain-containing protein n=1 Tax=Aphanomyces invadans TaxID=157072 RepID=A0A024UHS8_9STRA|nr:hypothetical protein H310_03595 [Aphanomyces invadans]ETW05971.1 hypothetical protein H310_03595 [Aphanomyces invadans]|eukprot:XP_008865748.1 hypothetical protein H310_03595 [Aphanomyces invadans]